MLACFSIRAQNSVSLNTYTPEGYSRVDETIDQRGNNLINEVTTKQPQIGVPETSNDTTDISDDDQDQGEPATKKLKIDDSLSYVIAIVMVASEMS